MNMFRAPANVPAPASESSESLAVDPQIETHEEDTAVLDFFSCEHAAPKPTKTVAKARKGAKGKGNKQKADGKTKKSGLAGPQARVTKKGVKRRRPLPMDTDIGQDPTPTGRKTKKGLKKKLPSETQEDAETTREASAASKQEASAAEEAMNALRNRLRIKLIGDTSVPLLTSFQELRGQNIPEHVASMLLRNIEESKYVITYSCRLQSLVGFEWCLS